MPDLFPVFLKLAGRRVLLVGGGSIAASKLRALVDAGADVTVVAPAICGAIAASASRTLGHSDARTLGPSVTLVRRGFASADLDGIWFVVAAATPDVNREVAGAADARGIFVNAVDDVQNASAYLGGVLRRDGVTVAVSTDGAAPALAGLLREGLDAVLPRDLDVWMQTARDARRQWLANGVPMTERRPLLLDALNAIYARRERA